MRQIVFFIFVNNGAYLRETVLIILFRGIYITCMVFSQVCRKITVTVTICIGVSFHEQQLLVSVCCLFLPWRCCSGRE